MDNKGAKLPEWKLLTFSDISGNTSKGIRSILLLDNSLIVAGNFSLINNKNYNGLVKIDIQAAIDAGHSFVDHTNVVSAVERSGDKTALRNARNAQEVLIKGGIPFEAMQLVRRAGCQR